MNESNVDATWKLITLLFLLCVLGTACESEYSKMTKRELNSGVVYEDLLFGMKFGQTRQDFYDRCWELNKQQMVSQGPGNQFAQYMMETDSTSESSEKVVMLFYGIFDKNQVMHGMHLKMSYVKWAPWNTDFHSPALMEMLKKKYLKEYGGNEFVEIEINDKTKAFVKVDGNRQILMYPVDNQNVTVKIQDLRNPVKENS